MHDSDELKVELLKMMREIWASDTFRLTDSERTQRLRPEIMRRLIGLVMTDDERASDLGLPPGCRVRESAKIISREKLVCGEHCWFGENSIVDASGGLSIGSHTTIASGVYVWTHSSALSNLMGENQPGNSWIHRAPTSIGSRVFIGGPSVIYPGVSIGDGVVVMPMSVVAEDVPNDVVVAGAPAVVTQKIDEKWLRRAMDKMEISARQAIS